MKKLDLLKNDKLKVGIFGSSFNPLHFGHLNLLTQVQKEFQFDFIKVIPNYQSPLDLYKPQGSPEIRLDLVHKVFKNTSFIKVDDQEIKRKGISYTIDTVKKIQESFENIFLIIGIDQLKNFDKWKDFSEIINRVHLVVCSREKYIWNQNIIPPLLKKYMSDFLDSNFKEIPLTTGKNIYSCSLKNMNISSSQIRELQIKGERISHLVPSIVEDWIQKWNLYKINSSIIKVIDKKISFCVNALLDKKAEQIKIYDLRELSGQEFNFSIVLSGLNTRHTQAMSSYLHKQIKKQLGINVQQIEGYKNGEWIILDYGDLVVHIFYHYTREYYFLEELWKDKEISLN